MVKFGQELSDQRIAEWRYYYVDYARLKGWIKELETGEAAQNFFDELTLSIERVESFYIQQEDALLGRIRQELADQPANQDERERRANSIKADIDKLSQFAEINREGLRKIGKKFDKSCLPARRQTEPADSGRNTKGQEQDWGSATEALQQRIIARFPDYRFATSADRLEKMKSDIHEWRIGAVKTVALTTQDLEAPLIGAPNRKASEASVLNTRLSSGFVKMLRSKWRQRYASSILFFIFLTAAVVGGWWKHSTDLAASGEKSLLNGQSFIVMWVTLTALTLLVWQWKSDSVMISATLFLNILGLINTQQAWGGFANSVVLSVAALSVVGDAVAQTGIVDILFAKLLGETKNLYVAMLKMLIPCCIGAASISNTCVMACSMPAIEDWCKRSGCHQGYFLAPISYLMLIGGTFAVFSTSTNLVAQALLINHNLPPLSTFELGVPAFINMISGLIYLMFATPLILGRFAGKTCESKENGDNSKAAVKDTPQGRSFFVRVRVLLRFEQVKTIEESGLLQCLANQSQGIASLERHGAVQECPPSNFMLQFDDILTLQVFAGGIESLRILPGFMFLSLDSSDLYATMQQDKRELVEVILDQGSPLVGHRMNKAKTFQFYAGAVVALRSGRSSASKDTPAAAKPEASGFDREAWLQRGDQVVLDVPSGFADQWGDSADFVMLRKLGHGSSDGPQDLFKAYCAGYILVFMLVFVAFNILPLFVCAMAAIVGLAVTKCATPERMKKAVPLNVVLTIVGALGLGNAIGQHGIAQVLAKVMVAWFQPFGQVGLLVAIWIVVVLLGVIFHGTAVVALMFPLCHQVAVESGIPLHQMVAVLCYAVACQMLSPVSYNTNLMAYAACPDYRFNDFTKLGFPLVIILFIQSIPMCRIWWPDSAGPILR